MMSICPVPPHSILRFSRIRFAVICLVCSLVTLTAGCTPENSLQGRYGKDTVYFMGLRALQQGDEDAARRHFKQAVRTAAPLFARRAQEELTEFGSLEERLKECETLYKAYPDDAALERLCRELYEHEEYARLIACTDSVDISACSNMTAYYRCESLYKKKDSRFTETYYRWCMNRPFEVEQYRMYCDVDYSPEAVVFRALVFSRNYGAAFARLRKVLDGSTPFTTQLLSDAGKTILYGSKNYAENAAFFATLAERVPEDGKFFVHFYSARTYDRVEKHAAEAESCYLRALDAAESAASPERYDNALWYYLNSVLTHTPQDIIPRLEKYRSHWAAPDYFDDFLETLSVRLLSQHDWQNFYRMTTLLDGYASPEICAKYCYVAGRLVEEGFLKLGGRSLQEAAATLFSKAFASSGTNLYYKLLAARRLGLSDEEVRPALSLLHRDENFAEDAEASRLLEGYADFGFPERIYAEWQRTGTGISMESTEKAATFLRDCADASEQYYTQSLRIAAKKLGSSEKELSGQLLRLAFPQDFSADVKKYTDKYGLSEHLLYALIRTESFFDPQVVSAAGATGLTQLMGLTAGDIAAKFKLDNYELTDSTTNIMFGSYYLGELIRRLDGSQILALFAYNGGISRVRSWVKTANQEFRTTALPKDLFLETVPFTETRDYGRKVVAAAAMYGLLYYGMSSADVIQEILEGSPASSAEDAQQ